LKQLDRLFHLTLWITVPINLTGAVIFSLPLLRQITRLPTSTQPFYGLLLGSWISLFGLGYLYLALSKRYDKTFLAIGAFGKLSFFVLALGYFLQAELGILALLAASIDAVLASIFLAWLWQNTKRTAS
jgi:hypothetical protein